MKDRLSLVAATGALGCLLALNAAAATIPTAPPKICIERAETKCQTKPVQPSSGDKIKWHPGNYMMPDNVQMSGRNIDTSQLASLKGESVIEGAKIIMTWGYIEGSKDDYSQGIAKIKEWLAVLKPINKRLVVEVITRRYTREGHEPSQGAIAPAYLYKEPIYNGGVSPMTKGFAARVWEQPTMDRLIKVFEALGKEFDSEPYFEAILTDETALGFPEGTQPASFSHDAITTQFKRLVVGAKKAFPRTNVIAQTNYLGRGPEDLAKFIKFCMENKVGIGGPDIMHPPHTPLWNYRVILGEIDGSDYRGKTPIGFSAEILSHKGVLFVPKEIHDYAFNTLGANYVFWVWHTTGTPEQNWKTGVLPYLRGLKQVKSLTAQSCPANLQGRCGG
jgi:hypothetical protein